jgi:PAS domain S-box-containing protein
MSHQELTYRELEARLAQAEAVIDALRSEQVDAIVGEKHLALVRLRGMEEALRESQRALTIRNQIAGVFLTTTDDEMFGEVLQVVLGALESKHGVFGYIDGEGNLVCPSMTGDVWDECQIPGEDIVFPPEQWDGVRDRAAREAKSFYSNAPLDVPQGHVPIIRAIAVPIIHRRKVIGLLEVANKESDYTEQDVELLDGTAGYIAPVLQAMLDRDRVERERRRAEQALRDSEQRYRDLVENVDDVLYTSNACGEVTYASPAIETMLGYLPAEVIGRSFTEFIAPEDLLVATRDFRRLVAGDSAGVSEYRVVSKAGEMRWMRVSGRPVFADHHIVGVRGVLSDITEWKRTERALQESERRYRQLVQTLQEGIWAIDQDGRTTFVNPRLAEMLGYTEDEMIGAALFSFMEEGSAKIAKRLLQREAIGAKEQHDFEFLCKDGTTFYASLETTPIMSTEGDYIGAIAAVADVTKRRRAEEELRAAKDAAERARHEEEERRQEAERRRQIAESLADVVTVLNSNRSLEEVLDYIAMQTAELLGNQAVGIYRLEEDGKLAIQAARGLLVAYATGREIPVGQAALTRAMASRQPIPIPDVGHRVAADGAAARKPQRTALAETWADIYQALLAVPIIVGDELYGGVALYYSEPREFPEEEVELATVFGNQVALAIENARLRDQVREAAAVAERERLARDLHDAVTQTLFSATLIAEALPRVWERSPDRARDALQELRSLTKGALAEMRTLLLELRPAALTEKPLGDLLGQLTEAMAGRSRVPIRLTVEGDTFLPEQLQIAMYRIAQEALNNIAKHADASEASVRLLCDPGRVTLRIRDDGCGFDPKDFLPEQLGMVIMRERADSIGARMEVTSRPGCGTEVAVVWQEMGGRQSHD